MKKKYVTPASETVNVRLIGSVLGGVNITDPSEGPNSWDAKENNAGIEEEEGLINPTQPNLWDDEED